MTRAIGRLNTKQVTSARPPEDRPSILLCDGNRLYLQVSRGAQGNIHRSWLFKFEMDGRRFEMGLGPLHVRSLKSAREKARQLSLQLLDGANPLSAKREAQRARLAERAKAVTFEQVAMMYYQLHSDGWSAKHQQQWRNSLQHHVFPAIGQVAPADIDSAAILKIVQPLWRTKTVTAGRILNRIEATLDYATTSGFRAGDNPARNTLTALPRRSQVTEVKHFSALPYDEIGALMKELAERDGLAPIALRFLILTAARTGEVIGATWPEIDLIKRVWSVPAARMKAKREHRALLSTAALDILRGLPRHSEQIFPLGDHMLLRELAGRRTSVHGLRASFRTWATERTNFADKIVEAALAHRIGDNKVQAAYERGDLLERRKKLMQAWCDFCTKPAPASTAIVPMRRA